MKRCSIVVCLILLMGCTTASHYLPEAPRPPDSEGSLSWTNQMRDGIFLCESDRGSGTAFYIGRGRVLTAGHVVSDDLDGLIHLTMWDGRRALHLTATIELSIVHELSFFDVAVLKIRELIPKKIRVWELAYRHNMKNGRRLMMVGCPSGAFPPSITSGILVKQYEKYLQVDLSVWPGFSGAPIIDARTMRVHGIIGYMRVEQGYLRPDVGYAVSSVRLRQIIGSYLP